MALEDRIRSSVDQALQSLVADLLSAANDDAAQQIADTEARLTQEFDARIATLEDAAREQTAADVRTAVEAETARAVGEAEQSFTQRLAEAVEAASAQRVADARNEFETELRTAVADAEARAATATETAIAQARAGEREAEMAGMARLLESIRGLDGAASLSEVLDALALAAARETARAAVVVLKGEHVVGWRLSGFGARDAQPKSIDLPLAEAGVIGAAVSSSRAATTRDGGLDGPGFEKLPDDRMGMAMPVLVGGRVVAAVYADGVTGAVHDQIVPSPWPEAIEVLARHAGRCLEALTAQKAAPATSPTKRSGVHAVAGSGEGATPGAGG